LSSIAGFLMTIDCADPELGYLDLSTDLIDPF
jgi:hypothetical protein